MDLAREFCTVRILIVEDEPQVASSLKLGLGAEGGFIVVHAETGTEGLSQATEKNPFDVIVLDILLPGLNGYEVLRRLRARSVWTPVLMLTAKDGGTATKRWRSNWVPTTIWSNRFFLCGSRRSAARIGEAK